MKGGASQLGFCVDQLDHVEMFVPDRWEAAEWYIRVLGFAVVPEAEFWAEDPHGPLMISSDGGSTKLALFEGEPQGERATAGFHRVAFRVSGAAFASFVGSVGELGLVDEVGRPVGGDCVADHDRAWSIYFSDPFGHRLEVTTYEYDEARMALGRVAG